MVVQCEKIVSRTCFSLKTEQNEAGLGVCDLWLMKSMNILSLWTQLLCGWLLSRSFMGSISASECFTQTNCALLKICFKSWEHGVDADQVGNKVTTSYAYLEEAWWQDLGVSQSEWTNQHAQCQYYFVSEGRYHVGWGNHFADRKWHRVCRRMYLRCLFAQNQETKVAICAAIASSDIGTIWPIEFVWSHPTTFAWGNTEIAWWALQLSSGKGIVCNIPSASWNGGCPLVIGCREHIASDSVRVAIVVSVTNQNATFDAISHLNSFHTMHINRILKCKLCEAT